MKIYRHIRLFYFASSFSVIVVLIFGIIYLNRSREQVKYIDAVEHTYDVISTLDICEKLLINAETAQRGHLLTRESHYKKDFESILPKIDSTLNLIGKVTDGYPSQRVFFNQLVRYVREKKVAMRRNVDMNSDQPFFIQNLRNESQLMDNCRLYMGKMREQEERRLAERVIEKNDKQRLNIGFFRATLITSCLVCIIAILIFFRELGIRLTAQQDLKAKINELSNSKKELEEITFAASHDLQEPMRKVRILSTLVIKKFAHKISEAELDTVYRINKIMEQMHILLNDLVLYTNLLNPKEKYTTIPLERVVKLAYEKVFQEEQVQFTVKGDLPVIKVSASQWETMFIHLFDNALKYKSPDRDLILTITYELKTVKGSKYNWLAGTKHFHQLTVMDNGIGFDSQYSDKIFGLFQRLHTQTEYPGKGLGLSIARRVMSNHNGFISSSSEKKTGACFILSFPGLV